GDRTRHLAVRQSCAHATQHAAYTGGDFLLFLGDGDDMALWLALHTHAWYGVVHDHDLLGIQAQQHHIGITTRVWQRPIGDALRFRLHHGNLWHHVHGPPATRQQRCHIGITSYFLHSFEAVRHAAHAAIAVICREGSKRPIRRFYPEHAPRRDFPRP